MPTNVALTGLARDLAAREAAMKARGDKAWKPVARERFVSQALKAYALFATSADRGAVRDINQVSRKS